MNDMTPAHDPETGEIVEHDMLAAALAAAQGEMKNAPLNQTNYYKQKYADLAAIRDATIPILSKNGLALTQTTVWDDGALMLVTTLRHGRSGQALSSVWPLPTGKPQEIGSAMTYGRRYCWAAMCGISAEQDDDGEEGQKGKPATAKKREPKPPDIEEIDRQREEMDQEYRDTVGPPPKPHLVKLPQLGDEKKNWGKWTGLFLMQVSNAQTAKEIDDWVLANDEMLNGLQGVNPDWHKRMKADIQKARDAIAGKEP